MRYFSSVILLCVLLFSTAIQAKCQFDFTIDNWLKKFDTDKAKQKPVFDLLKACLPGDKAAQDKVDYLAIKSLQAAGGLDKEIQKSFILYNLEVLHINAKAGDVSSQHNYAVLHNAEPGTLMFKVVPKNSDIFIYWTKKAAAQGYPLALFNLAVSYESKNPPEGIDYNPELAYKIFLILQRDYGTNPNLPQGMKDYIVQQVSELGNLLGSKKSLKLKKEIKNFDYSVLDS